MVRSGGGAGTFRTLECNLSPAMLDGLLPRTPAWGAEALSDGLQLSGHDIEWVLLKIHQELRQEGFAAHAMVEALATALAVALIRHFRLEGNEAQRRSGGLALWRMRLIRERVCADQPAPGLTELAELCGMSVRHLSRAFKAETGRTIVKFVEEATVERAREMLRAADLQSHRSQRRWVSAVRPASPMRFAGRPACGRAKSATDAECVWASKGERPSFVRRL